MESEQCDAPFILSSELDPVSNDWGPVPVGCKRGIPPYPPGSRFYHVIISCTLIGGLKSYIVREAPRSVTLLLTSV